MAKTARLLDIVRSAACDRGLIAPGDRVLAAFSGGPDSTALLHALWSLRDALGITVCAAHLNHGIRGRAAAADAAFARSFAKRLGVRFAAGTAGVPALAKREKMSLETAARQARQRFLAKTARRLRCGKIATGHTRDDQAETVLMHLLRGSGPSGLAGIPRRNGPYIRPLLDAGRAEVLAYLSENGLGFREDATNADTGMTRNRIRHRLIPVLKTYNPRIIGALCQLAETTCDESVILDAATAAAVKACIVDAPSQIIIDLSRFNRYNKGLQRRIVRWCTQSLLGPGAAPGFHQVERAVELLAQRRAGKKYELLGGLWVGVEYGTARIFRQRRPAAWARGTAGSEAAIRVPGSIRHRMYAISAMIMAAARIGRTDLRETGRVFFDWTELKHQPLTAGPRKPGERLVPFGSMRPKKIKELMIESKLPRARRDAWPVVRAGGTAIWVPGVRRSAAAPVLQRTKHILCLEFSTDET